MVYDKDFVSSQPEKSKKHNIDSFDDVVPRVCPFSFNVTDMPLEADKEMFYSLYHDGYRARNRKKKWIGNKDVLIPPFNFKVDYVDSKYWFHDLICSDKCFTDSHLNVAFYYLKKMRRCYPLDEFLSCLPVDAVFDTYIRDLWLYHKEYKDKWETFDFSKHALL